METTFKQMKIRKPINWKQLIGDTCGIIALLLLIPVGTKLIYPNEITAPERIIITWGNPNGFELTNVDFQKVFDHYNRIDNEMYITNKTTPENFVSEIKFTTLNQVAISTPNSLNLLLNIVGATNLIYNYYIPLVVIDEGTILYKFISSDNVSYIFSGFAQESEVVEFIFVG